MNPSFQHPLDTIYSNNSLLLLEAMIPYLDSSLQLPIALLIKLQEMRTLMQFFHNPSLLERYGFNRMGCGNEELMSMLCQTMGLNIPGQMSDMQSILNLANSMHLSGQTDSFPKSKASELSPEAEAFPSDSANAPRDNMIAAIRQILSEQEGESYESEPIA